MGELIEAEGVEVVGWEADGEAFLYRTVAEGPGEGAVIGVRLRPDGRTERFLVSLATDPGATPALRERLLAEGVRPDPTDFVRGSQHATRRYGPHVESSVTLGARLAVDCAGNRVPILSDEADDDANLVGIYVSPARSGWVLVRSEGRIGTAPATLAFRPLGRILDVYANADGQEVVDGLRARLGAEWTVNGPLPVRRKVSQTTLRGADPGMLAAWWSTLGLEGEPVIETMAVGDACGALVVAPTPRE